jgi:hypothetical protein
MNNQENPQDNFDNAVIELNKAGIQAKRQAYGFSVTLSDERDNLEAQCGVEHNSNISISVSTGAPPVHWFFRSDISAITELLIHAQERITSNRSKTWLDALQNENEQYNKQLVS